MKKIITIVFAVACITAASAQSTPACDSTYLSKEKDMKKVEPCVLTAADYVLSHPLHGNPKQYSDYRTFIVGWMAKTSYTFSLNENMMNVCKEGDNVLLFGVYTTCLAKAALQNKKKFEAAAVKLFVDYIKNPDNKVEQTASVKQLIEDEAAGKTEKYTKK